MIKNRKVTLAELNALKPCEPAEAFLGDSWSGTLLDILNHPKVSDVDKIWAVTKFFDEKHARLFAVHCARSVLNNIEDVKQCKIAERCINTAERFANGEATEQELRDAYYAADSATISSAHYAQYSATAASAISATASSAISAADSAADSAPFSAATYAATSAADSVADSAATSAAYAIGRAGALAGFVQKLREMITVEKKPKSKFVRTNLKLGDKPLYLKRKVSNE